jgi:hypothetical protein
LENFDPSPLGFSTMAGGSKEEYNTGLSDYSELGDYDSGSQNIPVFNESDYQVGLPVPDMTDISAGENNKYVYDRTIGTIGFTSTKIGGRRRGQADYLRGDLAIIPDKNTNFQVSADVVNTLMEGAMNGSYGIGQTYRNTADAANASQFGAQRAVQFTGKKDPNAPVGIDALRAQSYAEDVNAVKQSLRSASTNGGQNSAKPASVINKEAENAIATVLTNTQYESSKPRASYQGGTIEGLTVADLKAAAAESNNADNRSGRPVNG